MRVIGARCGCCGQFFTIEEPMKFGAIQQRWCCGKSYVQREVGQYNCNWTCGGPGNTQLVEEGDPV